jgi:hypothetical protein
MVEKTYTFTVTATNSVGIGPASKKSNRLKMHGFSWWPRD